MSVLDGMLGYVAAKTSASAVPWDRARPAPLVLVQGPEDLFAERAIGIIKRQVLEADADAAVTTLDAGVAYQSGALLQAASPSLFAERAFVVAEAVAQCSDAFLADAVAYVASPQPDAVVVLRHGGGVRGKKLLDAVRAGGFLEISCPAITRESDKSQFAVGEFRRAQRLIEPEALRLLVDAVGSDLRELASACAQLMADTTGRLGREQVERYYGGRVETTAFAVADAAIAGKTGPALALARHAMATGVAPVVLVAALAAKLRTMAKVGGARRRGLDPVRDLGLAPYAVTRAKRDLERWDAASLGTAIMALAEADSAVKGGGRAPRYAVEKAIWTVGSGARSGRDG